MRTRPIRVRARVAATPEVGSQTRLQLLIEGLAHELVAGAFTVAHAVNEVELRRIRLDARHDLGNQRFPIGFVLNVAKKAKELLVLP